MIFFLQFFSPLHQSPYRLISFSFTLFITHLRSVCFAKGRIGSTDNLSDLHRVTVGVGVRGASEIRLPTPTPPRYLPEPRTLSQENTDQRDRINNLKNLKKKKSFWTIGNNRTLLRGSHGFKWDTHPPSCRCGWTSKGCFSFHLPTYPFRARTCPHAANRCLGI